MRVADFSFELPDELIARFPMDERTASRLLGLDGNTGELRHGVFTDIEAWLRPGDLLVFNNTRVIPARLFGRKSTGGKLEILIERLIDQHSVLAHVRASKPPKPGGRILLEDGTEIEMLERQEALFRLRFLAEEPVLSVAERLGHMPLPPYIDRPDEAADRERYQTVYGEKPGAVAAPTAGLHFDEALLNRLRHKGIEFAFVTLHVGAGTFQPVRVDRVEEHVMHREYVEVSAGVAEQVLAARARGGRVVAVGTTSVRSLESAARAAQQAGTGTIAPFYRDTDIFIYPGYKFAVIDAMITNFHLPQSTLLMLVSAFAGKHHILQAYQAAIDHRYRFFSYGDAMFITRRQSCPRADG